MDQFDIELAEAAEQRSQVWRDARAGKFTASEIHKLFVEPRSKVDREEGKWSETAMTYIKSKVAEELTGHVHESSSAYPLVWGEEQEEVARVVFEDKSNQKVKKAGFVQFTDHCGGSPDGYVGDDAILEIKCPYNSTNQVEYLLLAKCGPEIKDNWPNYYYQMQANMLFTKRTKCYFATYDPRMPEEFKMHVTEVHAEHSDQMAIMEKVDRAIRTKLGILESLKIGI